MYSTVIFDLDGTLANTLGGIAGACNHVLMENGYPIHPLDHYKTLVGNGLALTIYRALPDEVKAAYKEKHPESFKGFESDLEGEATMDLGFMQPYIDQLIDYYSIHPLRETSLYPGIECVLDHLEDNDILWGIHTNKTKHIASSIARRLFDGRKYLGLSGPDDETARKPSPEGTIQLIGRDFNPEKVLYVGDTEVDVQTARNLGVKVASVVWGFRSKHHLVSHDPDYVIHDPIELLDIIKCDNK